ENMTRVFLTITSALVLTSLSRGGPENGAQAAFVKIASDPWAQTMRFKAGERASVFAKGDLSRAGNDATGCLLIEIYDGVGPLVASNHDRLGHAVAFWYPPRAGDYKIQIHNSSGQEKRIYICIK